MNVNIFIIFIPHVIINKGIKMDNKGYQILQQQLMRTKNNENKRMVLEQLKPTV